MLLLIPKLSISPKTLTIYQGVVRDTPKRGRFEIDNLKDNRRKGDLSQGSKRRLNYSVQWFLHCIEPERVINESERKKHASKISFLTLTISGKQETKSDYDHNRKCLNQFLTELRQNYEVKNYIWKLEKQKNGNVHYHLITDKKIPHYELRVMWNRIQNKFGYVDSYSNKHKHLDFDSYCEMYPTRKKLKDGKIESEQRYFLRMQKAFDFGQQTGWMQPNSTDIHSLYKVEDVAAYISKYFTKDSEVNFKEGEPIPRLWGCSQGISKLKSLKLYIEDQADVFLDELKTLKENARLLSGDYFTCILVNFGELVNKGYENISGVFLQHINEFREQFGYERLKICYD